MGDHFVRGCDGREVVKLHSDTLYRVGLSSPFASNGPTHGDWRADEIGACILNVKAAIFRSIVEEGKGTLLRVYDSAFLNRRVCGWSH